MLLLPKAVLDNFSPAGLASREHSKRIFLRIFYTLFDLCTVNSASNLLFGLQVDAPTPREEIQ
jgi:hypothetical protein